MRSTAQHCNKLVLLAIVYKLLHIKEVFDPIPQLFRNWTEFENLCPCHGRWSVMKVGANDPQIYKGITFLLEKFSKWSRDFDSSFLNNSGLTPRLSNPHIAFLLYGRLRFRQQTVQSWSVEFAASLGYERLFLSWQYSIMPRHSCGCILSIVL